MTSSPTPSLRRSPFIILSVLFLVGLVGLILGLAAGAVPLPLSDLVSVLQHRLTTFSAPVPPRVADTIIWQLRAPRVFLGFCVGALLSISGVILQGLLRNPLADPYILGVSGGAAVGAATAFILGGALMGSIGVPALAAAGAILAVLMVYRVARFGGSTSPETLILSGAVVSTYLGAILSLMMFLTGQMDKIFFWLLGSLSNADWNQVLVLAPITLTGLVLALWGSGHLDALLLGEDVAATLGVTVERSRFFLLMLASLLAAASVAVAGVVGFVGLVVPHLGRLFLGPRHRALIPASALAGGGLVVLSDLVVRVFFAPAEIPLGVVTALIGAPFFLMLLRRRRSVAS